MKNLLTCLTLASLAHVAAADTEFFNLSLTPDIAVQSRADSIHGLTLSVWGENQQKSLAVGIVNGSKGNSAGLSCGLVNYGENYSGVQWGPVNFVRGNFAGWQDGWFNYTGGNFTGWQDGIFNYTGGELSGLQSGVFNCAGSLSGVQIGLVNYAKTASAGLQIGLLNLIPRNQAWFADLPESLAPGMIVVNWRF